MSVDIFNVSNDSCPEALTDPMGSGWVNEIFGECIVNVRQWFAFCIGLTSIFFWSIALFPQLIKNCRTGKADQVLSFWFLLQWVIGDATNLIGAVLTDQLFTQVASAIYFVLIDCVMITQFVFYVIKNQGVKGLLNFFKIRNTKPGLLAILLPGMVFTLLFASHGPHMLTREDQYQVGTRVGRTLMVDGSSGLVVDVNNPADLIGYILGCVSATFYILSGVAQVAKNFKRCSVEGLSPLMYVLAVFGDVTYGLGILLYSVEPVFLLQRLPWLVGTVGTLSSEFIILTQFLVSRFTRLMNHTSGYDNLESDKEPLLVTSIRKSGSYGTERTLVDSEI